MFEKVKERIDPQQGMHIVHLRNEHGVEHVVQVKIGHIACDHCGAVHALPDDNFDTQAFVETTIRQLEESQQAIHEYAKKHGVSIFK